MKIIYTFCVFILLTIAFWMFKSKLDVGHELISELKKEYPAMELKDSCLGVVVGIYKMPPGYRKSSNFIRLTTSDGKYAISANRCLTNKELDLENVIKVDDIIEKAIGSPILTVRKEKGVLKFQIDTINQY